MSEIKGNNTIFVYICNECDNSLDLEIDTEFSKIPFEASWSCKCGNYIKIKWNGKELIYL